MAKKKKHDYVEVARSIVERAIGETLSGQPLPPPEPAPDPKAKGRAGGLKGGRARASKLSAAKRRAIAKKAAQARWKK